jgi:uncharacterized membrane protein YkvA (DUF1232 family)
MAPENSSDFKRATDEAREAVQDKNRTGRLAEEAQDKADRHRSVLSPIREDLDVLIQMVRSWAVGDYNQVPWKSIVLLVGGIIYFLNPVDLIPDFIYGLGFIDDIVVLQFVVRSVREDLDEFMAWKRAVDKDS